MTYVLFVSIAVLFLAIFIGEIPDLNDAKDWFMDLGLPVTVAFGCFILGSYVLLSPLGGIFAGIFGWMMTKHILSASEHKQRLMIERYAMDFVTSSAGMFASGKTIGDVLREVGNQLPEPLSRDFQVLADRYDRSSSFETVLSGFRDMSNRYGVDEFNAVSKILGAGLDVGGRESMSRGLFRLGDALRRRQKMISERAKSISELTIVLWLSIGLLGLVTLMDVTVARSVFETGFGRIDLGLGSGIMVLLLYMTLRLLKRKREV